MCVIVVYFLCLLSLNPIAPWVGVFSRFTLNVSLCVCLGKLCNCSIASPPVFQISSGFAVKNGSSLKFSSFGWFYTEKTSFFKVLTPTVSRRSWVRKSERQEFDFYPAALRHWIQMWRIIDVWRWARGLEAKWILFLCDQLRSILYISWSGAIGSFIHLFIQ